MKTVADILLILLCFIPVNNVILKEETKQIQENQKDRELTGLGNGSDMLILFLILILVYMLFNAPVWGMALITAPFIFSSANTLFGTQPSRKLKSDRTLQNQIKRALQLKDYNIFHKVQRNLGQMNLLQKYKIKKIDSRKLAQITHDYFHKYRPQLGAQFHKRVDFFADVLFKRQNKLRKLMDNM